MKYNNKKLEYQGTKLCCFSRTQLGAFLFSKKILIDV